MGLSVFMSSRIRLEGISSPCCMRSSRKSLLPHHYFEMLIFLSAEVLDFQQLCRLATASSNSVSTGYPSSVQTQRDETSSLLNRK